MGPHPIMGPEGFRAFLNRNLGSDLARQINTPGPRAAHPSTPIGQFRYQPRPRWLLKPKAAQLLTAVRRQDGTPVLQVFKPPFPHLNPTTLLVLPQIVYFQHLPSIPRLLAYNSRSRCSFPSLSCTARLIIRVLNPFLCLVCSCFTRSIRRAHKARRSSACPS